MRQWVLTVGTRDLSGLRMLDAAKPVPGPGEVLVRVKASSLNYADFNVIRSDFFGGAVQADTVPLSDGAGIVEEVGPGVKSFVEGDHVCGLYSQSWLAGPFRGDLSPMLGKPGTKGMLTEYVVLPETGIIAIPKALSFEAAATLPCACLTAWNALCRGRSLASGETLLLLGAGGVSMMALELGKAIGAKIVITSSSDDKLARAKRLGADIGVNYRTRPDWGQAVLDATDGYGADKIVETGGMSTLTQSIQALAPGGEIGMVGVRDLETSLSLLPLQFKAGVFRGVAVGSAEMFGDMLQFIVEHKIEPVIDRIFSFTDAVKAYEHLDSPDLFGKIVISHSAE